MFAIAVLIGAILTGNINEDVFLAMGVAIFVEISIFSLNDYFDREIDVKNRRMDRPLVRGDISPKTALFIYFLFLPLALLISYMINMICFLIAVVIATLSTFYDIKLKKIKIAGNIYVAFTMAIPFIFGAYATEKMENVVYFLSVIAFLAGLGREIMKDILDFEGDAQKGVVSLPLYIGKKNSAMVSSILYIATGIVAFMPFFMVDTIYYHNYSYLFPVMVADGILFYVSMLILTKNDKITLMKCRKLSIFALIIGLIAFMIPPVSIF